MSGTALLGMRRCPPGVTMHASELGIMSGRFGVGDTMFDRWEVEDLDDVT